jgi:hypothetical protein
MEDVANKKCRARRSFTRELRELRRQNRRLQADVDLLKRAMPFFAKETR